MARILLIEHSSTQRQWVAGLLHSLGHDLRWISSMGDALKRHEPQCIDLVLLPLLLETSNGFEVGVCLREAGYKSIVLMCTCERETDAPWAKALGLQGIIPRPPWPEHLEACLQQIARQPDE
jgi:twitching motility two-component system response regulator PilH